MNNLPKWFKIICSLSYEIYFIMAKKKWKLEWINIILKNKYLLFKIIIKIIFFNYIYINFIKMGSQTSLEEKK